MKAKEWQEVANSALNNAFKMHIEEFTSEQKTQALKTMLNIKTKPNSFKEEQELNEKIQKKLTLDYIEADIVITYYFRYKERFIELLTV